MSYIPSKMYYDRGPKSTFTQGSSKHSALVAPDSPHLEDTPLQDHARRNGIVTLGKYISRRSMLETVIHDSPATCHPETRQRTLTTILSWINKRMSHESVLWLYGAEGIGKSAIMQTVAGIMAQKYRDRYAGAFFISEACVCGGGESRTLVPTLAYQIAENLPGMRDIIDSVVSDEPNLPTETMQAQMEHLITIPLKSSANDFSRHTPLILIDGLDECQDPDTLKQIISIIAESISVSGVPLRFLIASRPVDVIKDAFSQDPLFLATKEVWLDDSDSKLEVNTDADIERFYIAEFASIYEKNPTMRISVPRPWPSLDDMRLLTFRASGNFLYASTMVRFIEQGFGHLDPDKLLKRIARVYHTISSTTAVTPSSSALDILYTAILSVYPRPESLKAVIAGLVLRFRPIVIETILGVEKSEIRNVLKYLKPLINLSIVEFNLDEGDFMTGIFELLHTPRIDLPVIQGHRSFREYLRDRSRSGPFFIDLESLREGISATFLGTIANVRKKTPARRNEDRNFLYDAAYSLADGGDKYILPTLLPLLSKSPSFLLALLRNRNINSLIPEIASLFISLYCIESHVNENLQSQEVNEIPEDIIGVIQNNFDPTIVQSILSSESVGTVMDHLSNLIDDQICQRSKGRRYIEMKKEPIQLETHQVHYEDVEEYFGNVSQPRAARLFNNEGSSNVPTDPTRVRAPFGTRGRSQSGTKSSAHPSSHGSFIPSVPQSSLMASSSSGQGGRSVYSRASSRTTTTDYGLYYTRRYISGDSQYR